MSLTSNLADEIPGLLKVALIFKGSTPSGRTASIAVLIDGNKEVMLDLNKGLATDVPNLTKPMRSYLSGLSQVGQVLKTRKIEDEDGVTEDDIERAALTLAFPRAAQNAKALSVLKSHLDALQENSVLPKAKPGSATVRPAEAPEINKSETKETLAKPEPVKAAKDEAPKVVASPLPPAIAASASDAATKSEALTEAPKATTPEIASTPKPAADIPLASAPEKVDLLADPSDDDDATDAPKPPSAEDFKRARELSNGARKSNFFNR